MGGGGVLNAVVKQGGDDGVLVKAQVQHDVRHGDGVDDIGLAAFAQLPAVVAVGVFKGGAQPLYINMRVDLEGLALQLLI